MPFLYFTLYNPTADAARDDLKGAKGYLTNFFKSCGVLGHALFARILLLYNIKATHTLVRVASVTEVTLLN